MSLSKKKNISGASASPENRAPDSSGLPASDLSAAVAAASSVPEAAGNASAASVSASIKRCPPRKKPLDVMPIREVAEKFLLDPMKCIINRPTLINLLAGSDDPDESTVNKLKYQIKIEGEKPGKMRNPSKAKKGSRTVYRFVLRSYLLPATGFDPLDYCRGILGLGDQESLNRFYEEHGQKAPDERYWERVIPDFR